VVKSANPKQKQKVNSTPRHRRLNDDAIKRLLSFIVSKAGTYLEKGKYRLASYFSEIWYYFFYYFCAHKF
jgi:hypothetical protein